MPQTSTRPSDLRGTDALLSSFRCTWKPAGLMGAWIHLSGELDLAGVPELARVLGEAGDASRMVLVDLRDLEFIDCAAAMVLVRAGADARAAGKSFVLVRGSGQVDRLLGLAGLLDQLEVIDLHVQALPPSGDSLPPLRIDDQHDAACLRLLAAA